MSDTLTITLTETRPVQIVKDDWPIVARAKDWDNEHEFQANRTWRLTVRQHEDGRCIVYGVHTTQFQNESDRRGGVIVDSLDEAANAISEVGEHLGFSQELIEACVADLPAVRLS